MSDHKKIVVSKDGPYIVSGSIPLSVKVIGVNKAGESERWVDGKSIPTPNTYALCRCGESSTKPFCDGTHTKIGFDGTETASRKPILEQAQLLDGPELALADAEHLCAFARFCDPNGRVWNQVANTDDPAVRDHFLRQVGNCHSGRLIAIDKKTGKSIEPHLPKSIGVVEDPGEGCSGPLWVRGGIQIVSDDGYECEVRNRVTLCRCGRSENKPYCNGAHAAEPKFTD